MCIGAHIKLNKERINQEFYEKYTYGGGIKNGGVKLKIYNKNIAEIDIR